MPKLKILLVALVFSICFSAQTDPSNLLNTGGSKNTQGNIEKFQNKGDTVKKVLKRGDDSQNQIIGQFVNESQQTNVQAIQIPFVLDNLQLLSQSLEDGEMNEQPQYQDQSDESKTQDQKVISQQKQASHYHHWTQFKFWRNVLVSAFLCCVGGFCSGMTVGLMSIETIQLQIMGLSEDQHQKQVSHRILSVVSNHHLFLVTLLLANAIALESLPIVVHSLMPDWAAIIFSTFIVLIVAEIIPQAYCTGPKKIALAYHACPIILGMIKFFWILAYPMAKGLDYLLGQHNHQRIQHKDFANFLTGGTQSLKNTEKLLLTSILQLRTKRVPQIMVPLSDLYMLSLQEKLTPSKIRQINKKDYSYILVYKGNRTNVVGVLKTKQFAIKYLQLSKNKLVVEDLFSEKQDILCVYEDTNLLEMLMLFHTRSERYSIVIGKKKKIQPGIQSIMYSKSDMIAKNTEGQILGVVFLYNIFESITEYNQHIVSTLHTLLDSDLKNEKKESQLKEIEKPLLTH